MAVLTHKIADVEKISSFEFSHYFFKYYREYVTTLVKYMLDLREKANFLSHNIMANIYGCKLVREMSELE